jgi:glutamate formiminotransferase
VADLLLAVPNFSGTATVEDCLGGVAVLDVHRDADHNRTVVTLAGAPRALVAALAQAAAAAIARVDLSAHAGLHPHVGVLDVAPIVYLEEGDRGRACATALALGDALGEAAGLPVLLYGELAGGRTRAALRRGGPVAIAARIAAGEPVPDFGPRTVDPRAGVTLVAARPPLIAFNAELAAPAGLADARRIADAIRESGSEGLPGVRAIGLWLPSRGLAQVSMNLESWRLAGPADAVAAIARHAPVRQCELVGLAPRAAFAGFPLSDVPVRGLRFLEDEVP